MKYRQHRYPTDYLVPLRTPHGPATARVTDCNNGGARLAGVGGLERGDKLRLDILSHYVDAVVLWAQDRQAGIAFRPQLSDRLVDTLRKRTNARSWGQGHSGFREMR